MILASAVRSLLLLAAFGAAPAAAESLVVTLSTNRVEISSNFTGTAVALFGAIERDAATVSRSQGYDLVVVLRGPPQSVVTRRKERWFGIWVNRHSETYDGVPAFYSVHATRPLGEIGLPRVLDQHEIGLDHITLQPPEGGAASAEFRTAFLRLKQQEGLYTEDIGDIDFPGANIFQTAIRLPSNVPVGTYGAAVYLFSGGALLARSEGKFTVAKSGFEQFATGFARNESLIYGLVCIGLALFIGWLAGVIFRRD